MEVEAVDEQHLPNQEVAPLSHILAARPPFRALTVVSIAQTFGGLNFMPTVTLYLHSAFLQISSATSQSHSSSTPPVVSQWDHFNGYHRLSVPYPKLHAVHMSKSIDRIQVTPYTPPLGHSPASAA